VTELEAGVEGAQGSGVSGATDAGLVVVYNLVGESRPYHIEVLQGFFGPNQAGLAQQ